MRNLKRIQRILDLIEHIWSMNPDLRYMQLIDTLQWEYSKANNDYGKQVGFSKCEYGDSTTYRQDFFVVDLFHLEDDVLEDFLGEYIIKLNSEE